MLLCRNPLHQNTLKHFMLCTNPTSLKEEFERMFFNVFILFPPFFLQCNTCPGRDLLFIVPFRSLVISEPVPVCKQGRLWWAPTGNSLFLSPFRMPEMMLYFSSPTFPIHLQADPLVENEGERGSLRRTEVRVTHEAAQSQLLISVDLSCSLCQVLKGRFLTKVLLPVFVHSEIQTGVGWKSNT